jgi:ArsR family transcriptional regulator
MSLLIQQETLLVSELCVCELTYALDLPQPKISHHLANLRKSGLVSDKKVGLWIYYQLHPDLPQWVSDMLKTSIAGINNLEPYNSDNNRLLNMPERPENRCSA